MTDRRDLDISSRGTFLTLGEIAHEIGGRVDGDPDFQVHGLAPIHEADQGQLGILTQLRYRKYLEETRAESLLVTEDVFEGLPPGERPALVIVDDANAAIRKLVDLLYAKEEEVPDIHPTAVLGRGVTLGSDVSIDAYAVIEAGATLGDRVRIGAHAVVGKRSAVGDDSVIHPHVVVYRDVVLGRRVVLHAGARIGSDGFGYVFERGGHQKVRQVGGCVLEDDVEVGANSCVDRGSIGTTRVGAGSKLDNLVHLGHNVVLGKHVLCVAQVGVSGSTRIGDGAILGGQVGIAGHLEIGAMARLAAQSGVIGDVEPGETVMGFPARPQREYLRAMGVLFRLPDILRRLKALESGLDEGRGRRGKVEDA